MADDLHFYETVIPLLIGALGVLTLFGWPIVWIVAYYTYEGWKTWNEAALKRDMVARGYTAQEIVQVVGAKKGSQFANTTDTPPAKPVEQPAYGA